MSEFENHIPKLKVIGLGGAGCNAVDSMIASGVAGVEFIAANTDAQALSLAKAGRKIQLGRKTTRGLGSGAKPEVGTAAAEESLSEISDAIMDADILFIAAGMGGGTGSGAAPVAAALAREKGILTVAVITTPFEFEGERKSKIANDAVDKLNTLCDSLIVLPNQNLFKAGGEGITFKNACQMSDVVLLEIVKNITDLIMKPGLINLDFADIKSIMSGRGRTIIGSAVERGDGRAERAVVRALDNPIFAGENIYGASGILVNITGNSENLTLSEVQKIMDEIRRSLDTLNVDFVFGTSFDDAMGEALKVSVIATGINGAARRSAFAFDDSVAVRPAARAAQPLEQAAHAASKKFVLDDVVAPSVSAVSEFDEALGGAVEKIKLEEEPVARYGEMLSAAAEEVRAPEPIIASSSTSEKIEKSDDAPKKKKSFTFNFFEVLNASSPDKFGDEIPDVKLSTDVKEEDNVVFIGGSASAEAKKERQTDLMEFIQSSQSGLGIPSILKKTPENS